MIAYEDDLKASRDGVFLLFLLEEISLVMGDGFAM
jgi:hypothetical protein